MRTQYYGDPLEVLKLEEVEIVESGGNGTEAWVGKRVVATTAGSEEKLALCRELGADIALNYNDGDFAPAVLEATDNQGMGWSFASDSLGQKIQEDINSRYLAGEIKAVVGQSCGFDNLPQAVKDLADRKTTGRSIILLDSLVNTAVKS